MSRLKNEIGNRYALLTVIEKADTKNKAYWICKCDCGNITTVSGSNLRNGSVKSCGCLRNKSHLTHHLSKHPLYNVWYHIKRRCLKEKNPAYKDYGGRGITICEEWEKSFESFYFWAINNGYENNLTIDRIDNNKGYSPDNCRWTDSKTQCNNRRSCVMITYNGKTQNLMQWCEELGLNYKRIHNRLYKCKWSFEKAISIP